MNATDVHVAAKLGINDDENENFDEHAAANLGTNDDENENVDEHQHILREGGYKSSNWPHGWTTFDGGYESEAHNSNDEGSLRVESEDEDNEGAMTSLPKRAKKRVSFRTFSEIIDIGDVCFEVGLRFVNKEVLKKAMFWYGIQQHKDIVKLKNDNVMFHVACNGKCRWQMTAGPSLLRDGSWQINSLNDQHECARTFENHQITDQWLASEYMDQLLRNL